MSSEPAPIAIDVTRLTKRYQLGEREPYGALRDTIVRAIRAPFRRQARPAPQWINAVDDVSFQVRAGEVVGIVGRNGSGKSTLLKVLSRITEPTAGRAVVRGRVGSLLEVGTGFHPELTGRDNVFVNGAILGMRRAEIARKFEEIVEFAGVSQFIDTPVKHYSSGMQMRLAFAVAAHLEPHILLVDEVLAVGDIAFQRKCLGKMDDVRKHGRTVLFVSHQMNQIRRLCENVMWLDGGRLRANGPAGDVLPLYERTAASAAEVSPHNCFVSWSLEDGSHTLRSSRDTAIVKIVVRLAEPVVDGHLGVNVHGASDEVLVGWAFEPVQLAAGVQTLHVTLESLPLRAGGYRLSFALFDRGNNLNGGRLVEKWPATPELVLDVPPYGHPQDAWAGLLNVPARLLVDGADEVHSWTSLAEELHA
jgi:ABC-type polysaccharide/polyol phosphate transport system ATPase subunit